MTNKFVVDVKDVGVRAGKTFLQAAIPAVPLTHLTEGVVLAGMAAGLSAVYNGVVAPLVQQGIGWIGSRKSAAGTTTTSTVSSLTATAAPGNTPTQSNNGSGTAGSAT